MLSKKQKVKRDEFPKGRAGGNTYNSKHISLFTIKKNNNTPSKFSFVVSSKVSKHAVDRNLLKRRGYYFINKNKLRIKSGFICVLFFKKNSNLLKYKEIEGEIVFLFNKSFLFIK